MLRQKLKHHRSKIAPLLRRFKKTALLCACILAILLGTQWLASKPLPPTDVKIVEVEPVQRQDLEQTARFIGTIRSQQATTLVAKSSGLLQRVAHAGQTLKKGDLIAHIENKDIERSYKLSEEAETIAQKQYERVLQLVKSGVFSQQAIDEKKHAWIETQKRLSDAKIALETIKVYAPFDGIVGLFKPQEGSQIQTGETLVSFYDPTTLIVEFDVPVSMVHNIQDNSPVLIHHQRYALTHIQRMMDEETHMCPAYVAIRCHDCIIGTATPVELIVQQKKSVLVIPYESLFLRDGKTYVYLVKDNKAALTPVEPGLREKARVEIVSGLAEGDVVITHGQARLYPGISVEVENRPENKSTAQKSTTPPPTPSKPDEPPSLQDNGS